MKCFLLTILLLAISQPNHSIEVPDDLKQWVPWVQHEQEFHNCPHYYNKEPDSMYVCAWPQKLNLTINKNKADFSIVWEIIEDSWVPLPGNKQSWPQNVTTNGNPIPVQINATYPRIYLQKGTYQVKGNYQWKKRPEEIHIPGNIADIQLTLDGSPVHFPRRENNALWLGNNQSDQQNETNNLKMKVNRLIIDGHPMTMYMNMEIIASGNARTEILGTINPEIFQITHIDSDLSTYVNSEGKVMMQIKPGDWSLNLAFIVKGWPEKITFNPQGTYWPKQEIWAYQDNKNMRLTYVEGVTPINPEQVFSDWDQVPNYLVNAGDTFVINEQKRGTLNQSEQINLHRKLWLTFNGESYRSQDLITGTKLGSWRINAQPGYQLLSAKNQNENLLITQSKEGLEGIELRIPNIYLQVNGEFTPNQLGSISLWQNTFDNIYSQIHLPHGYMAFASRNVDSSQNVWLDKWRLWDIFIVMLLTAFTYKFINFKTAVAAFIALVLGYQEFGMPLMSWGAVMIAIVILFMKPSGKIQSLVKTYAYLSLIALMIMLIPFLINQMRLSLHPQLDHYYRTNITPSYDKYSSQQKKAEMSPIAYEQTYNTLNAVQRAPIMEQSVQSQDNVKYEENRISVSGSRLKRSDMLNHYQQGAILQAGRGTPNWNFNQVALSWDGPITADQDYQLYLITPPIRVLWRLLLIITSTYWFICMVKTVIKRKTKDSNNLSVNALIFTTLSLLSFATFSGNFPEQKLLQELQSRLNPKALCIPNCATIESANIEAENQQMRIRLNYHALADVIVPIPHSKYWSISEIKVNNETNSNIISHESKPWIHLKTGVNTVVIQGIIDNKNNVSIEFPIIPGHVTTQSDNWQFAGIEGNTLTNDTLQLITSENINNASGEVQMTQIKQFVKVTRNLLFDDRWQLHTKIERIAPSTGAINLSVPLVANEQPYKTMQLNSLGNAIVSFAPTENTIEWRSVIDPSETLQLTANDSPSYLEIWRIISAPQWNIEISGIPIVAPQPSELDTTDFFEHIYMPRPGENITITVSRPKPIEGDIISIESIKTDYHLGKRTTKSTLEISYQATQSGNFEISIPTDAQVKKVSYDGIESNLVSENGVIPISSLPGKHNILIEIHTEKALNVNNLTPEIGINKYYSNLTQTIRIPRNRWLLWGKSEGVGPAFLYWGEILAFSIIAFFLARMAYSPLKFWQWLALGVAFGTFSWKAFTAIAVWLFFIGWKKSFRGFNAHYKNVFMQWLSIILSGIIISTIIAAVGHALLSHPDMGVRGAGSSYYQLQWFLDVGNQSIPDITLFSVPLWWYKSLMLIWSVWVSFSLINWIKQLANGLNKDYWWFRFKRKKKKRHPEQEKTES